MSFVQRLRMANMFPVRSNLGNAEVSEDNGPDFNEVINIGKQLALFNKDRLNRPNETSVKVDRSSAAGLLGRESTLRKPMKFGGIAPSFGGMSSGGMRPDVGRQRSMDLYESYKNPVNAPLEGGPSNDEMHYQRYLDNSLKNKVTDSNIASNDRRLANDERRLDNEDKRIAQGDKRIENTESSSDRRIRVLEENAAAKKDLETNKQNDANALKLQKRETQKTKAQEALNLIDEMMDPKTGKLNPDIETATGWSANVPMLEQIPGGLGTLAATGNAKLNQLQGMLTLDLIKELKEQSKTGATGFGALNLRELGVLENSASKLAKRNMDEGEFPKEFKKIQDRLKMILQDESSDNSNVNNTTKSAPQAPEGWEYVRNATNTGWTPKRK